MEMDETSLKNEDVTEEDPLFIPNITNTAKPMIQVYLEEDLSKNDEDKDKIFLKEEFNLETKIEIIDDMLAYDEDELPEIHQFLSNPGTTAGQFFCKICQILLSRTSSSVQCNSCKEWCHYRKKNNCSNLKSINEYTSSYKCSFCSC